MPVYIIRAGEFGPVKIGTAMRHSLISRLDTIQSMNHERLSVVRILDGDHGLEILLHQRFHSQRLHGEWFEFSDDMAGDLGGTDDPAFAGLQIRLTRHVSPGRPQKQAEGLVALMPRLGQHQPLSARIAIAAAVTAKWRDSIEGTSHER